MSVNNYTSITDARTNLPGLVNQVDKTMQRVTITVNGKPKAILISQAELESLEETLDILSEPGALEEIRAAEKEFEEGRGIPLEDVIKELKLDVQGISLHASKKRVKKT